MTKKIAAAVLAVVLALSLASCGKASPSDVVKDQLEEVKSEKMETSLSSLIGDASVAKKYSKQYTKLVGMIQDFDYEIGDEKIASDGKTATVEVKITTYPFGKAYRKLYNQVVQDAEDRKIDSDTDMTEYIYKQMFSKMLALKDKTYHADITVKCTKNDDGDWETNLQSSTNFRNALLGGTVTETSKVQKDNKKSSGSK